MPCSTRTSLASLFWHIRDILCLLSHFSSVCLNNLGKTESTRGDVQGTAPTNRFLIPHSAQKHVPLFFHSTIISRVHVWGHWAIVFFIWGEGIVLSFSSVSPHLQRMTDCFAYAWVPRGAKQMEEVQAEAELSRDDLHKICVWKEKQVDWVSSSF